MNKYGPSRSELKFRLYVSIAGLGLLIGAVIFGALPIGPAMVEIAAIAGAFFGGTLIWTLRQLRRSKNTDEP